MALVILAGGGFIATRFNQLNSNVPASDLAGQFNNMNLPLSELAKAGFIASGLHNLNINGQLQVKDSIVLGPIAQPASPITGQLYFDQTANELAYYNGSRFISINDSSKAVVQSLGGSSGALTIGAGLNISGNQLTNTGVLSVGGQSGAVTLGPGLAASGNQLLNTGVLSVVAGTGNLTVATNNGTVTISTVGIVSVQGGHSGKLAKFTGSQTVGDSILTDSGTAITVGGNLNLTAGGQYQIAGAQISSSALANDNNLAKLDGNQTFTGNNTFKSSTNSTTALQVQNASGSNVLTIDTVNGRIGIGGTTPAFPLDVNGDMNLSAGSVYRIGGTTVCTGNTCAPASGSPNYIQNGTTVQSNANFAVQSSAAGNIGAIVRGASGQTADLFDLQNSTGTNMFSINPSGAATVAGGLTISAGGATITAGGVTVSAGGITVNAGGATITGNSTVTGTLGGLTGLTVASGTVSLPAASIADSALSANVAKLNAAQTFTAANIFKNGSNSVTAFQIQNAAGTTILDVDTTNGRLGIGTAAPAYPLDVTGDINSSTALRIGGTSICTATGCTSSGGSGNYIQNGTTIQSNANFAIQSAAAGSVGAVVRGASGQTGDLLRLQTSTPATVFSVGSSGAVLSKNSVNSTTAFQVQNAAGTPALTIDTTNLRAAIGTSTAPDSTLLVAGDGNGIGRIGGNTGCGGDSVGISLHGAFGSCDYNFLSSPTNTTLYINRPSGSSILFNEGGTTQLTLLYGGAAQFQNTTNSTGALTVKNAAGSSTVLNVDTTNNRVGIGTAAPSRPLDVAVNNSLTTAPMALLEQAGTGHATLEFKTPAKSFILGQDANDASKFKISSSTASSSPITYGKSTIGAVRDTTDQNTMNCAKYTTGGLAGTAASFSVYVRGGVDGAGNNSFQGAIYTDNGSGTAPTTLVASSATGTLQPNAWTTVTISGSLSASTVYWLCANNNSSSNSLNNWAYDDVAGSAVYGARTYGTWPASFGSATGTTTQFSFYVTYTPSGTYDSFAKSLLVLGETGQAIFQNSANSTTAFQIQNAAGTPVLVADTTNSRVAIGTATAPDTTLLIAGDGTGSGRIGGGLSSCGSNYTGISLNGQAFSSCGNYNFISSPTDLNLYINRPNNQAMYFRENNVTQFTLVSGGAALFQNGTNSVTAFRVQNAAASTTVLDVDTTNSRVGVGNAAPAYPLDVTGDINSSTALRVGGTSVCTASGCTAATGSGSYIQNGTAIQSNANFAIQSSAAGNIGAVIRGAASQTADLLDLQNSSGTNQFSVTSAGVVTSAGALTVSSGGITVSAGGITVTGNSTINGTLGGLTGLTVASGGASITGNSTITGTLSGLTGLTVASGGATVTAGGLTVSAGGAAITGNSTITGTLGGLTGLTVASGGANVTGNSIFKPTSNSVTAFQVQNAAASTTVLNVDTTNNRVGIANTAPAYPLDVTGDINSSTGLRVGGTTVCTATGCTASGGSGNYIQNGTTIQSNANFAIQSAAAGSIGAVVRGAASQTADLLDLQNSAGTNQFSVSGAGAVTSAGGLTVSSGGATITSGGLTVSAGGIAVTGNSTITGTLGGLTGLTVASGGAGITGNSTITGTLGGLTGLTVASGGETITAGGLTVSAGGANITGNSVFKPTSNSVTAFQVQNAAASTTVLNVDTTNNRVGVANAAPAYPLDVTGDINSSTALRVGGTSVCTSSGCTSSSGSGNYIQNGTTIQANANFAIQSAATGSVGALVKGAASQTADLLDLQNSGGTNQFSVTSAGAVTSAGSLTVSSGGATVSAGGAAITGNSTITGTLGGLTGLTVASGGATVSAGGLTVSAGGANVTGTSTFKPTSNSVTAFQVQNAAASTTVLDVDTTNTRVGINNAAPGYTLDVSGDVNISSGSVYRINGTAVCSGTTCTPASGSTNYIQNGTAVQANSNFAIQSAAAGSVVALIRGAASQTADLFDLQTSTPATVLSVSSSGAVLLKNSANSTTAFQVQNSAGTSVFAVDTSGQNVNIGAGANLVINNTAGNSITGPAWTTYTPTWTSTGTAPSLGNGTLDARYYKVGRVVNYVIRLYSGTTTTYGGAGWWTFSLPFAAQGQTPALVNIYDANLGTLYVCSGLIFAATSNLVEHINCGGSSSVVNSTYPFTWSTANSTLMISGSYESST